MPLPNDISWVSPVGREFLFPPIHTESDSHHTDEGGMVLTDTMFREASERLATLVFGGETVNGFQSSVTREEIEVLRDTLVNQLRDFDDGDAGRFGLETLAFIAAFYRGPDPKISQYAGYGVGNVALAHPVFVTPRVLDLLERALASPERRALGAVMALGHILRATSSDEIAARVREDLVIRALVHPDPRVLREAVVKLGEMTPHQPQRINEETVWAVTALGFQPKLDDETKMQSARALSALVTSDSLTPSIEEGVRLLLPHLSDSVAFELGRTLGRAVDFKSAPKLPRTISSSPFPDEASLRPILQTSDGFLRADRIYSSLPPFRTRIDARYGILCELVTSEGDWAGGFHFFYCADPQVPGKYYLRSDILIRPAGRCYGMELFSQAVLFHASLPTMSRWSVNVGREGRFVWKDLDGFTLWPHFLSALRNWLVVWNQEFGWGLSEEVLAQANTPYRISHLLDLGRPDPRLLPLAKAAYSYDGRYDSKHEGYQKDIDRLCRFPGEIALLLAGLSKPEAGLRYEDPHYRMELPLDWDHPSFQDFRASVDRFWLERKRILLQMHWAGYASLAGRHREMIRRLPEHEQEHLRHLVHHRRTPEVLAFLRRHELRERGVVGMVGVVGSGSVAMPGEVLSIII